MHSAKNSQVALGASRLLSLLPLDGAVFVGRTLCFVLGAGTSSGTLGRAHRSKSPPRSVCQ